MVLPVAPFVALAAFPVHGPNEPVIDPLAVILTARISRIVGREPKRGRHHGQGEITKAHLHHGVGSGLGIELLIRQFDRKFVPPRGSPGK